MIFDKFAMTLITHSFTKQDFCWKCLANPSSQRVTSPHPLRW